MLTTLDATRLVPRLHSQGQPATQQQHVGPVFTVGKLIDLLEDRPEICEALRQSRSNYTKKESDNKQ